MGEAKSSHERFSGPKIVGEVWFDGPTFSQRTGIDTYAALGLPLCPRYGFSRTQTFEILGEQVQCPVPCLRGSLRIVAVGTFVVEAMECSGVDLMIVRTVVFSHCFYGGGYVLVHPGVFLTVMGENRRLDLLHEIDRVWAAAVKNDNRRKPAHLGCGREGHFPAPAKSDESAPVPPDIRQRPKVDKTSIGVFSHFAPGSKLADIAQSFTFRIHLGCSSLAGKIVRSECHIPLLGQTARHILDVIIQPLVCVNQNQRRISAGRRGSSEVAGDRPSLSVVFDIMPKNRRITRIDLRRRTPRRCAVDESVGDG